MRDDLRDLYQEVLLDHYKRPRNFRVMAEANRRAEGQNPLCGDEVTVYLLLEDDVVKDVSFQGAGCAISMASASMMTASLKGKTKEEAEALFNRFHQMLTEESDTDLEALGKLAVLSGVREFPIRVKCATLPWHTFRAALEGSTEVVSTE
ncbi:MAG: SUF system NifU family Fe-S cluster assembly protein [Abditibacteriales bacterium]|nr:SUF system NifU family Fe-S cluster assembly protein [Abditibacteriales bacterium]MDW8367935.1 SUF system NifU family Fe-S cluster assembly protein [Abditibacteriales bacterium]